MRNQIKIQEAIIRAIKEKLPSNISFVDEMAECLGVSKDSVYRRLRGEKLMDIDEVSRLVTSYGLSLDQLMSADRTKVTFNIRPIDNQNFTFDKYLDSVLANLSLMTKVKHKELYYSARDLPIFHYFQFEELSAFKISFWMKNYLAGERQSNNKFWLSKIEPRLRSMINTGKEINRAYFNIPSTEIWTNETANITLRQIEYSHDNGILSTEDAIFLCNQYNTLLTHIRFEIQERHKINLDNSDLSGSDYQLYVNEVAIGDNSILFEMDTERIAFITYNNINYLSSSDPHFSLLLKGHFDHSIQKSTLISGTSEKIRNKFFNTQQQKVHNLISRLEQTQHSQILG